MNSIERVLNLGCGHSKITGAINVDCNGGVHPDLVFNIKEYFPLPNNSFDKVLFFHCIEHVEKKLHGEVLTEIHRVLRTGGTLVLSYPEFSKIIELWKTDGNRKFWEATIYGRQAYEGDYHYAAMDSLELRGLLAECGFKFIKQIEEPTQEFNTVMWCEKIPLFTYERLLYDEIFLGV